MHVLKNGAELLLHYVFALFVASFIYTDVIHKEPDSVDNNSIAILGIVSYLVHKKRTP